MEKDLIKVKMLGDFSIEYKGQTLGESAFHSKKSRLLLAYMIYNRSREIAPQELIDLLWSDKDKEVNGKGSLKTAFYRVRSILDELDEDCGHRFILNKNGVYSWNNRIPLELDTEVFEEQCYQAEASQDLNDRLNISQNVLAEYDGLFLNGLENNSWVKHLMDYYSNLYLDAAYKGIEFLEANGLSDSVIFFCRKAIARDPYNQSLYAHLIRNLIENNDRKEAAAQYNIISEKLGETFGIQPDEELRELYKDAVQSLNEDIISFDEVYEQLQEQNIRRGALVCDYDFFKILHHSAARAISRTGEAYHLVLLTLSGKEKEMAKHSLARAMDNMQDILRSNLRAGDSVTRCSKSQFIVMLPHASFENGVMICKRIIKSFNRQFPHSPAQVEYAVKPVKPIEAPRPESTEKA